MKKIKFDLERALRGDELITRDNEGVMGFTQRFDVPLSLYPYETDDGCIYMKDGRNDKNRASKNDLFMKYPELKEGMKILVRDGDDESWKERIFVFKDKWGNVLTLPLYNEVDNVSVFIWKQFKLIEEPAIEIHVKINGKEGKLSDISTETFEKLKELGL